MNIEKNDEYISVLFSGNLEYVLTSVLRMDQGLFGFNAKSSATKWNIVGACLAYGFSPQALLVAASFAITQRRLCNFIIIFYFNLGLTFFRYSNHGFSRFSCPTFTLYPCAIQQSRRRSGRVIQEFEKHFHRTDFQSSF